jgi:hypothetical protein
VDKLLSTTKFGRKPGARKPGARSQVPDALAKGIDAEQGSRYTSNLELETWNLKL